MSTTVYTPDDPNSQAGAAIAVGAFGDLPDPVVAVGTAGKPGDEWGGETTLGGVYVLASPFAGGPLDTAAVLRIVPTQDDIEFGEDVVLPGDVTGDGVADLVAGVWVFSGVATGEVAASSRVALLDLDDTGGPQVACGPVVDVEPSLCVGDWDLASVSVVFGPLAGTMTEEAVGVRLAGDASRPGIQRIQTVDVDADGRPELVVTTNDTHVVSVPAEGQFDLEESAFAWSTAQSHAAGDIDGDGVSELELLGDDAIHLSTVGGPGEIDVTGAVSFDSRDADGWYMGFAAALADYDGDGHEDMALGDPGHRRYIGRAHVFLGPLVSGALGVSDADIVLAATDDREDRFGETLFPAHLDGDGRADLVVGAPGDDRAGADAGAVHLVFATDF